MQSDFSKLNLKIEYLPIDSLKPYERNAKQHPEEQIEQIKRSILQNGMNDPIGIWGADNTIVEGHGRLMACKELGYETVPVIRLDHLTDEQRREYALVHNQTTMNSGWDFPVLDAEIADLPDFDAEFFGFELPGVGDAYIDDFFDRGVEAKEKPVEFTLKCNCGTQEGLEQAMTILKEAGFSPEAV